MIANKSTRKTKSLKKSFYNKVNYKTNISQEDFDTLLNSTLQDKELCPYISEPKLTTNGMEFIRSHGYESFTGFVLEEANTDLMRELFSDSTNYETKILQKTLNEDDMVSLLIKRARNYNY